MTLLAWLLVCVIWSTVWLFIKLGVTDVPPFAFAATRLLLALVVLLYLAIAGSLLAFWLNYWLMARIGPTRMLLTSVLEPLLAVLLGAIVLGERLSSRVALGGALVLASVALVMRRERG